MPATAGAPFLLRSAAPQLARLGLRAAAAPLLRAALPTTTQRCGARSPAPIAPSYARCFSSSPAPALPASAETQSYRFNHTMIRIKDPKKSLDFYENVLGMTLLDEHDAGDFKLFFLGYQHQEGKSRGEREALLELTWNKGTEDKADFKYHNGNDEPQGFGHLAIAVDDVAEAEKRFDSLGVNFKKRTTDGKMRHIAFILDPDNYWIEIVPAKKSNI
ncbi:glyoxalase I [Tilletiopsis washingtonensis]|uniref:lactoylglutathione lyase n=1 Tax=Tilletiopsis washingtonensis TaxID=58919 RepID=A0A316Z4D3_9BASI|nr:glyoxalase I [Tilletiopsis washingtonensis]PWN96600.1 glyoxalase I [Tilletiopsis washingtonensis]